LPNGIKKDRIVQKLNELKSKKIRFVIDSASFSFEDYKVLSPLLVKPNETEIKAYGKSVEEAVCRLLRCGIEYIAYSKCENGIELYNRNNKFIAKPPQIIPLSTVGAGDSAVAGFIYGLMKNLDIKETLKYAVSFGTANCMSAGGNPPSKFDVKELFEKIIIL
jgi:1-phosphofructokinase